VVAAAIAAALRLTHGVRVAAFKPVLTGTDEPGPRDDELLAAAAGSSPDDVTTVRFGPPVSPHLAAAQAGVTLDLDAFTSRVASAAADAVVVEGVGGLLVPLSERASVRDLALGLGLPLVVAARPGLGTINHTLLTLEAARGLRVAAVVLTPWPAVPSDMETSNRETIARVGGVPVHTLPHTALTPEALAAAAAGLPVRDWL
jgi:dethiobiotin synthetase